MKFYESSFTLKFESQKKRGVLMSKKNKTREKEKQRERSKVEREGKRRERKEG